MGTGIDDGVRRKYGFRGGKLLGLLLVSALPETTLSPPGSPVETTGSVRPPLTGAPVFTYFATTTTSRIINPTMATLVLLAILFLRLLFREKILFTTLKPQAEGNSLP
jgi:hypothetical protein